ncbi:MAG: fumarylacetoacetate hydrolase family protein [Clostridia bacterium]|nr:fumarylacetoacetate hydrolase family protein [Clostridia bacterium]
MKFCKFYTNPEKTETQWGIVEGDIIKTLTKAPYDEVLPDGGSVKLSEVALACPCDATKIVAIGRNYYEHILEFNSEVPKEPLIFLKPTTALTDPDGSVEKPDFTNRFDYEGEIAVVMAKKAKNVKRKKPWTTFWATPASTTSPPGTFSMPTASGPGARVWMDPPLWDPLWQAALCTTRSASRPTSTAKRSRMATPN